MNKPAFTYVELLIAVSFFTVAVMSVLQIFPLNRRYLAQSADTTQAAFLAQEEFETIASMDYGDVTVGTFEPQENVGSSSTDPLNIFQRQTTVSLIDGNHAATSTDVGLKKVTVTISWPQRTITRTYSVSEYVVKN